MSELTTIDTNNYAAMAKAMGIANEGGNKQKASTLARLRIQHSPILGDDKVLVKAGQYKMEIPDGETYYASSVKVRPYMQRFMYKRFVKGSGNVPNRYVKTVMADTLTIDLKDNDGGFNCGKPAGYIQDFQGLPKNTQELIRQIKRVRVVLGTVELIGATDSNGNEVNVPETAFIWEIENRDAFKEVGNVFAKLNKMKRLPVQHIITANTDERKLPNGNSFFLPMVSLDVTNTVEVTQEDQDKFSDFMSWVSNYNEYIINAYAEKASPHDDEDDAAITDGMIDIELEEEVA
jgi:hypothetical protein|tara:strand:+ start:460 stop:1332 length:873 start_codon:yes stop_codon:yes gene_type:complete